MATTDLTGHVAIVTGANHGIGASTAVRLAECGAAVLITYLRSQGPPDAQLEAYLRERATGAEHVLDAIESLGGAAEGIEVDLADVTAPAKLFDVAEAAFGPVDILINNASSWIADTFTEGDADRFDRPLKRVSAETIDRQMGVDLRASALLISEFARRHALHGLEWGRIIGLTSGGPLGFPEEVSYGAAKAALENYTMSAAFELADRGITANIVHPPVTDTGWITEEVEREVARDRYLIHVAQPEDVAEVIAYLASAEASLITGNKLHLR
jgi:3-oxoacyl-[acyl-carrier protein] reductase